MLKKIEHGAQGIITQPVFDLDNAKILLELMDDANRKHGTDTQLVLGVFPITKLRTAQFLDDVADLVAGNEWVTEWQYTAARPALAERADLVVWLDLSFLRMTLPRVVSRTVRRRLLV